VEPLGKPQTFKRMLAGGQFGPLLTKNALPLRLTPKEKINICIET